MHVVSLSSITPLGSYLLIFLQYAVGLDLLSDGCVVDAPESLDVPSKVALERSIDRGIVYRYDNFYKLRRAQCESPVTSVRKRIPIIGDS